MILSVAKVFRDPTHVLHPLQKFKAQFLRNEKGVNLEEDVIGRSRRELSESVSFGVGTLFVAEKLGLENRFRGCLILCQIRYTSAFLKKTYAGRTS